MLPLYCCEGAIIYLGGPTSCLHQGQHPAFEGHHCALLSHPPTKWRKLTAPPATRIFYSITRPSLPQPPVRGDSTSSYRTPPTILPNMLHHLLWRRKYHPTPYAVEAAAIVNCFTLGGILVVWLLPPCVQLLALLLGSDSCGVVWVSWCAVWVPACIGCMCLVAWLCDTWLVSLLPLSLGGSCAPSIVFVTWHLTM